MPEFVERDCPSCGKRYQARTTRLKWGRETTCSRACSYALRASSKETAVSLACAGCGAPFERWPSHFRSKHGAQFCSRACHYAGRSAGLTRRVVEKPYTYTPDGKAAMVAASRAPKGKHVFHIMTCAMCGGTFDDPNDGRKRVRGVAFCSLACCNTYRRGKNHPCWKGGHSRHYGPSWPAARRAALARDLYSCRRCGAKANKAPDVHHIQPVRTFAKPDDAHGLHNLVSLCHPCHMHVEHHGMDFTP